MISMLSPVALNEKGKSTMANLLVRNIDDDIANAIKLRARQHGISAEAEHRRILEMVLTHPKKKSFIEVLSEMPNVGEDANFARIEDESSTEVFDGCIYWIRMLLANSVNRVVLTQVL